MSHQEPFTYIILRPRRILNLQRQLRFGRRHDKRLQNMELHKVLRARFHLGGSLHYNGLHIDDALLGNAAKKRGNCHSDDQFSSRKLPYLFTYLPQNLTICLERSSSTMITHCTVLLCLRNTRKHCLPLLRDVCTRPRIHTGFLPPCSASFEMLSTKCRSA